MDLQFAFRGARHRPYGREYKLLSLDVFDTCLIRDFVSQESLWCLVGRQIISTLPGVSSPTEFIKLRGRAEDDARGQGTAEDITLANVYTRLAAMCGWSPEQQRRAMTIEEGLEFRGLRLNPAAQDLLARAHGAPVCYLSDTPHRAAFIRSCLDAQSLPAGEVLSSGDLGLRKGTGSLFREASKRFGVAGRQMLHVGNDARVDGAGSAIAGVAFAPVFAANATRYEVPLDRATSESGGLLGAVLAGASRDIRLAEAGQSPNGLVSVVSGVAGPLIFAAVAWTLLSAQRDHVEILYFAARDGEIMLAVAQMLQEELGIAPEMECRYLYGSRQAWHLPALSLKFDMDPAAVLRQHLIRSYKVTMRGLLELLDISEDEAAALVSDAFMADNLDTALGDRLTSVIDVLVSSPEVQSLALERAKKAHEVTMAFLTQEKMFSGSRVGLVDIGWHGAAAASLVAMASEQETEVTCYFAGGLCGPEAQVAPEGSRAFLINTRSVDPELKRTLINLIESFCVGSGGSTLGYMTSNGQYLPRLAPAESNPAMGWGLRDYQALVCSYAANVCRSLAKLDWTITVDEVETLRPYLIANLRTLWSCPTYEEAELWGSFPAEGENGIEELGRVITVRDFAGYPLRPFRSAEKSHSVGVWKRAAIARTVGGRHFADPFALLQALSQPRGRALRATARSKLTRRRTVQLAHVDMRDGKVTVASRRISLGLQSRSFTKHRSR